MNIVPARSTGRKSRRGFTLIELLVVIAIIALLMAIGRTLQLRPYWLFLALCCSALSPLTLTIHAPGNVDSHFMEQSLVFLALWRSLVFFRHPDSLSSAILLDR